MPTPNNDTVSVLIAGRVHSTWSRYQIDSDFLIPSDAWSVTLGLPGGTFPTYVERGAPVQVKIGNDTVMVGRVAKVQRRVSRQQMSLSITGFDGAKVLVDCASPIFTSRMLSLEEVIAKVVRPLGITNIRIEAESSIRSDKVSVEPGERAWDTLVRAASARGLWPWFTPDGSLVIGGPDYTAEPVATLVLNRDGRGNNILDLSDATSIDGTYSELTVLAQGHAQGSKSSAELGIIDVDSFSAAVAEEAQDDDTPAAGTPETGFHGLKAVVRDPTVPYYRPQIMVVGDADNLEQVRYRARKAMADARLNAYELTAVVKGHRNDAGVLWQPGQRIRIRSEPHGIDDVYFLMGREFSGGRPDTTITTLRLKEDGIWIPDAYPKKRKARKRKAKVNKELAIVDVE
ncbi:MULTISPECIES: phage baseplate assembly protein [Serratia]|jgi:prophage tail gpP-like protein|uniref:phage baseplate assembly protein n=1 Tax=Serratia TaxID=613 RepID=UPI0027E3F24C|nr:phage tail protein [Serratia marcescens]MCH4195214.1 phage tail protein [Serratia liquefaciens]MCH4231478.1 phage tail protein [Serratia liquefaciens]MCH4263117.1 phage tail protein [Serratia liquefaciens]MCI1213152.1 phage tail protein [Serratia liquefaciens]MCI1234509.1 phage tail protein [Serratia liquefaciens]